MSRTKIAIIAAVVSTIIIGAALVMHFRLSETEKSEIQSGQEQKEKESPSQVAKEIVSSLQNKTDEENENTEKEESEQVTSPYIKYEDSIQIVTIVASELKFTPSEVHINAGKTKFVIVNDGKTEHEFVAYEASKVDIVDKAEIAEDEDTIKKNILTEVEEVKPGQSGESEIIDMKTGSYVFGCHVPGHYQAGMKGNLTVS